jgi:hypothetical protein
MGEQFGIFEDNKLSKDGYLATIEDDKKDIAAEVADACAEVTDEERCQAAVKIGNCLAEEGDKRGLE